MKRLTPAVLIEHAVQAHPTLRFGEGRCFAMFALLRSEFGVAARPYYDGNHVTTEIGGRHYDARGEVAPPTNAIPLAEPRTVSQIRRHAEELKLS